MKTQQRHWIEDDTLKDGYYLRPLTYPTFMVWFCAPIGRTHHKSEDQGLKVGENLLPFILSEPLSIFSLSSTQMELLSLEDLIPGRRMLLPGDTVRVPLNCKLGLLSYHYRFLVSGDQITRKVHYAQG